MKIAAFMELMESRVLLSAGSLDSTFGAGGWVAADFAGGNDRAEAMAVLADGKILVGGTAALATGDAFALVRYNPDGTLDSTFGVGGQGNDRLRVRLGRCPCDGGGVRWQDHPGRRHALVRVVPRFCSGPVIIPMVPWMRVSVSAGAW